MKSSVGRVTPATPPSRAAQAPTSSGMAMIATRTAAAPPSPTPSVGEGPLTLQDTWSKSVEGVRTPVSLAISPDGGRALTHGLYGGLAAFDPKCGDVLWSQACDRLAGAPVFSNDGASIVTLSNKGKLLCVDTTSGEKRWESALDTAFGNTPTLGRDGSIYLRSNDNRVFRCDGDDGHVIYATSFEANLKAGPLVARDGAAFVLDWNNTIHVLEPDGSIRWKEHEKFNHQSWALGDDDTLYVSRLWGSISARNPMNGELVWDVHPPVGSHPAGGSPNIMVTRPSPPDPADPRALFTADHAHVLVGSDRGFVYSLDGRNGNLEWTSQQTLFKRPTPQALPDGTVVAPADGSKVFGLDPRDGEVLWQWHMPTAKYTGPRAGAGGRLLWLDDQGTIHMAEPPRGRWTVEASARTATAPQAADRDNTEAPTPAIQVGDGWIIVGGVRIPTHA